MAPPNSIGSGPPEYRLYLFKYSKLKTKVQNKWINEPNSKIYLNKNWRSGSKFDLIVWPMFTPIINVVYMFYLSIKPLVVSSVPITIQQGQIVDKSNKPIAAENPHTWLGEMRSRRSSTDMRNSQTLRGVPFGGSKRHSRISKAMLFSFTGPWGTNISCW